MVRDDIMLKRLCSTTAVSGYETNVIELIKNELQQPLETIYQDAIGNLICFKKGVSNGKKILIASHCDEVGLQISKIKNGKIKFKAIGNIKCYNLFNQRVVFENGCKGIILAENNEKIEKYNYENMYIELFSEINSVEIGDVCTFENNFLETDRFIISKGLDNRAGCFILYRLLMSSIECQYDTYVVFTAQEEIGLKGMKVALSHIKPDICVALDLTPECPENNVKCGAGTAIKISDSVSISNRFLVSEFKKIAQKFDVMYQLEVNNCGASEIALVSETGTDYKGIGISIPAREIHAANTMVEKSDLEATYQLLERYLSVHA